jgi:O-antigen/teichoic acid export membrane protein
MVNASLNLASLCGITLMLWWLFSVPAACFQIWFILTRRADTSPEVIVRSLLVAAVGICRIIGLPGAGIILFMDGWRLDPILQLSIVILCILLLAESSSSVVSDFSQWRRRLGRAVAVIEVDQQPEDNS